MPAENALSRLLQCFLTQLGALSSEASPAAPPEGHGSEIRPVSLEAAVVPTPRIVEVP
jgi:hypothetical protein